MDIQLVAVMDSQLVATDTVAAGVDSPLVIVVGIHEAAEEGIPKFVVGINQLGHRRQVVGH
jgi:hypothetical protein